MSERIRVETEIRMLLVIQQPKNTDLLLDANRKVGDQIPVLAYDVPAGKPKKKAKKLVMVPARITARSCEEAIQEGKNWLAAHKLENFLIGEILCTDEDRRGIRKNQRRIYIVLELHPDALRLDMVRVQLGLQPMDAETFAINNARNGQGLQKTLVRHLDTIHQRTPAKAELPTEAEPLRRAA